MEGLTPQNPGLQINKELNGPSTTQSEAHLTESKTSLARKLNCDHIQSNLPRGSVHIRLETVGVSSILTRPKEINSFSVKLTHTNRKRLHSQLSNI